MVKDYFRLKEKHTSLRTEIVAGLTTFLTMAYIIFVNPAILGPTGMNPQALIVVTCLVSAAATISVGIFARAPLAMAPGMGLNAFFAYLITSGKMNWQEGLGVVFVSGLFFLALTLLGLRKRLVDAIPRSMVSAIAVGIGLFITFIGLTKLGIVVNDEQTLVTAGPLTPTVLIGLFGLGVMIYLEIKRVTGALLIGILASTALAAAMGRIELPAEYPAFNIDISPIAFKLEVIDALKWGFFGSIFTLMFMDMFDSIGTLVACCHQAGMTDEQGNIKGLDRLLGIDAIATMFGALMGTSTTTAYAESAAGIEQGGRTGLTAVTTGVLFLLALVFVPVVKIVPQYATAPALIMVGLFMMKQIKGIDFGKTEEAFPAFIIIVMIALSYSISTGLAFGFVSYTLIKTVTGNAKEVKPAMWIIAVLSVVFLALDWVSEMVRSIGT